MLQLWSVQAASLGTDLEALVTLALVLGTCCSDEEATGSATLRCATKLYPAYSPKSFGQCVAVCQKCNRGVATSAASKLVN